MDLTFSTFGADLIHVVSSTPGCWPGVIHIQHHPVPLYLKICLIRQIFMYWKIIPQLIANHPINYLPANELLDNFMIQASDDEKWDYDKSLVRLYIALKEYDTNCTGETSKISYPSCSALKEYNGNNQGETRDKQPSRMLRLWKSLMWITPGRQPGVYRHLSNESSEGAEYPP